MQEKELQNNLSYQLSQANKWVARWYNTFLKESNLTISTVFCMQLLNELDAATPSQLAKKLGIRKPTMTAQLDRMVRDELVIRSNHSSNRKISIISLTPEGKSKLSQASIFLSKAEKKLDGEIKQNLHALKSELSRLNNKIESILEA